MALATPVWAKQDWAMPTRDLVPLLQATWFAADLSPAARGRLAALGRLVDFSEGSVVLREGAPCESLGVVITGRIAIRLSLPGGEDRTILTVHAGDVFGWSAVLPEAISTSTAVAVAPTTAVLFDGDPLRTALATDCDLAAAVYGRLLVSVARRLTATRVQLLDLYRPGNQPW
jgi:CRP/FNR family transcriptional regulator, cyclic AMP receptor protein